MNVIVYGKADCVQCRFTENELSKLGVPFEKVDVTVSGLGEKAVRESGKTQLPMVVAGDDVWHGFRVDKIRALKDVAA